MFEMGGWRRRVLYLYLRTGNPMDQSVVQALSVKAVPKLLLRLRRAAGLGSGYMEVGWGAMNGWMEGLN